MYRNFSSGISVSVSKDNNKIVVNIESDYSGSQRKSRLYVKPQNFTGDIERVWKSIKTKKLQRIRVGFFEIDYYDDMTDVYEIPTFEIKRGLRKCKVGYSQHGSIPKEWGFNVSCDVSETKTVTPIVEIVSSILSYKVDKNFLTRVEKESRKVVSGKVKRVYISTEE